ncbi:hypothetical protein COO59_05285 [Mixta theicola]|uniref:Probable fimbrial chaperone EcpB n=1 Tax=Mixta theicola TaxID=1458355 RepID=A0A2K1QBY5_9GAMM|nr:hypothetical protein [Mixta theicola]PNS12538.1 hypothetical protein COO59_05285 [Mixta theicola]GLR10099.1 hypothetical protein GCM10007905_28190 [Mixta theicola]
MKINSLISFFLTYLIPFSVQAINIGEVTSIMPPAASTLAKEIGNPTDSARLVSLKVERISSPMENGIVIPMDSKSELLATPVNLIMPGKSKENFRIFYNGPEDDKERYYRLSWSDEPVTDYDGTTIRKQGQAMTSAIINTILVVAPRKEKFDFLRQGDTVTNKGNSSFRVISYGPCRDKTRDLGQGCRERYYLMPDVSIKLQHIDFDDRKSHIGIWHGQKYINVN